MLGFPFEIFYSTRLLGKHIADARPTFFIHHHQMFAHAMMNHLLARDGSPIDNHGASDAVSGGYKVPYLSPGFPQQCRHSPLRFILIHPQARCLLTTNHPYHIISLSTCLQNPPSSSSPSLPSPAPPPADVRPTRFRSVSPTHINYSYQPGGSSSWPRTPRWPYSCQP